MRKENLEFDAFADELQEKHNAIIQTVFFDLSDEDEISNGLKELFLKEKQIDVLVNNAGMVSENRLFQMTKISDMKRVFDVNFFAAIKITQIVCRLMARAKSGSIINVCSVAGLDGDPGQLEYSCSKAALACATKKLAIELGRSGIRVNAVAPGLTDTSMLTSMNDSTESAAAKRSILERRADPSEIAEAILFLAGDKASFITGQILRVDGGVKVITE